MKTDVTDVSIIPLEEIEAAQTRLHGTICRTPLVPLNYDTCDGNATKIWLKLEILQPTTSFKIRGACNALECLPKESIGEGVYTASAGNFAQGLAWKAKELGIPCHIVVPDNTPRTKVAAIQRLEGIVHEVPYDTWWQVNVTHKHDGIPGQFIPSSCDRNVIAGNGTMGLEILEDLPEVDTIFVPFGGGGSATGIASAVKAKKPGVKIIACEVETATPLTTSFAAGKPSSVVNHRLSFVDGIGGKSLSPSMWRLLTNLIDDTAVLNLKQVADAIKLLLERNRVLAEGAGATSVAAALSGETEGENIVCVVSGGNIDSDKVIQILQGQVPQ